MFLQYLKTISEPEAEALQNCVISVVKDLLPDAVEGISYGLPAFKVSNKAVLGFSANKHGLNVYPYDPRIVEQVIDRFPNLEHSSGVIRFSAEEPLQREVLAFIVDLKRL